MSASRRRFVRTDDLAAAAAPLLGPHAFGQSAPAASVQRLRRGVGFYSGQGGTIGVLASPDALVVVDTQFPARATAFWTALTAEGGPAPGRERVDVLVNTHHHGDHTGGNPVLGPRGTWRTPPCTVCSAPPPGPAARSPRRSTHKRRS